MIDPNLKRAIDDCASKPGINTRKLKVGDVLQIRTKHSVYTFYKSEHGEKGDCDTFLASGGYFRNYSEPQTIWFRGSTWGGSVIKNDWIGEGMHMEFVFVCEPAAENKVITTSKVKSFEKKVGED